MSTGLSGPLFKRGCFQLFTEQGLLSLENGGDLSLRRGKRDAEGRAQRPVEPGDSN